MRMLTSYDRYAARLFTVLGLGPLALVQLAGCGKTIPCDGEAPVKGVGDEDTGYETCEGGWVHRPRVVECASAVPRATTCDDPNASGSCTQDSDCTDSPYGHCDFSSGELAGCFCRYGCTSDADCGTGQICVCGNPVGQCATASCTSDADCGGGRLCSTYITTPGCGGLAYACQRTSDECQSNADCPNGTECTIESDHRVCGQINCAIGRPFLVDGEARVAGITRRDDWCARGLSPSLLGLTGDVRETLASEWAAAAQMEHASVAAFARFAMQLLALGAPPELLSATHAAMADETEHARACFAMASAYAGAPIGPDRLSLEGALAGADLSTAVRLAIVEGCIGETVAAIEAAEAASRAEDPAVRGVLARISDDEGRHAELAWRFVRWAIAQDAAVATVADAAFDAAIAAERARPIGATSAEDEAWLRHGVARATIKAEIRRRVVDQVVAPAARAMVSRTPSASLAAA